MKDNLARKAIRFLIERGLFNFLPDRTYLKLKYWSRMGKKLNLDNPKTFNEKIQWLKLYDRKPEYTKMVDKYEVKKYVENVIGKQYIIPTLGVWDKFDDINFNLLPNKFVLKCTHDSGGIVICKDKTKFDIQQARKKISKCLKRDYYLCGREWPYKNVKHRIIAEQYMEDTEEKQLIDYKFYTFNGEAKVMFIVTDRQNSDEKAKMDYFDLDFNHLDITISQHPNAKMTPKKPKEFETMKKLAEKLSINIPHLRVDFYEVNGKVYFGELTFADGNGMTAFYPEIWDKKFGDLIKLPPIY